MDRQESWVRLAGGVGWCRREVGLLAVVGPDASDFLQRMLTRDLTLLEPGCGREACFTDRTGKLVAGMALLRTPEGFLARTELACAEDLRARLARLVFMDRVEVVDLGKHLEVLGLHGLGVGPRLKALGLPGMPAHPLDHAEADGLRVVRVADRSLPGVEVWGEPERLDRFLLDLEPGGAVEIDADLDRALRVEAGVPTFGVDHDGRHLPTEAGLAHTVSTGKGCYPGQEILERMRSRGVRTREMVGLVLEGEVVPESTPVVTRGGEDLGRATSLVLSPHLSRPVALAILPVKAVAPGDRVEVAGVPAEVRELPMIESGRGPGLDQEVGR